MLIEDMLFDICAPAPAPASPAPDIDLSAEFRIPKIAPDVAHKSGACNDVHQPQPRR